MTVDDCYQLGYVVKAHGLKGEVQIYLDVDSPEDYKNLESVFVLQGQQLVPFFIESISVSGAKAIVAFEEVLHVDDAKSLKGCELYLPLAALPVLDEGEFYIHEVVGFDLINAKSEMKVGVIEHVLESGPQLLFSVLTSEKQEILIPYDKSLLKVLNRQEQFIMLEIPEGLLDIYLNEDAD